MPWRGPRVEGEFPTGGYAVIEWIESTLSITDGRKLGQPFKLYDEQAMHLLHKYRLDPEAPGDAGNDAFRYGGSMLVRGQKWGKDPLLAALDLAHAFGPCEFAGWDAQGEPVMAPHPSPWVAVAATNDQQTDNTWLPLIAMLRASELVTLPGVEANATFVRLPCGNLIEPITSTALGRLGGRFTKVSITESGIMVGDGPRGGLKFARTLKRNVGGMQGMWTAVTNTWDPTENSDAQVTYEARDPHTFVDARLSRSHVDLDDDEALADELRYLYGDTLTEAGGHTSLQRMIRDVRNGASGESEVRRFFLSEIIAGERTAVDPPVWTAAGRADQLQPGEAIALGFDGSRTRDATALIASRMSDGRLFELGTWVPAESDGRVDRVAVDRVVRSVFEIYDVSMLFADPYYWQDYLDMWSNLWPKRVVEFPTTNEQRMDAAIRLVLTGLQDGSLTHALPAGAGADHLTAHALSAALTKGKRKVARIDDSGVADDHYLRVIKKRDGALIDAFIAAILAAAARGKALTEGWQPRQPSVYEKRGLRTL